MRNDLLVKYNKLKKLIRDYKSVLIGLSGGVDSALLAKVSYNALSSKALAVIGKSSSYPKREELYAKELAKSIGISFITIETSELDIKDYRENKGDRCYFCKKELYVNLLKIKKENKLSYVLDGTNLSDITNDDRPGVRAISELGVKMPLFEAGFLKEDVRELARDLELPNWDKASFACLSSRVPIGTKISSDILKTIEKGEDILYNLGFKQFRLRYHENVARIELVEKDLNKALEQRLELIDKIKNIGFKYVTLDLTPYKE